MRAGNCPTRRPAKGWPPHSLVPPPLVATSRRASRILGRSDKGVRVQSGRLRVVDASALLGLRRRTIFRLLHGLKQDGAVGLLSRRRGKMSNHRYPLELRADAVIPAGGCRIIAGSFSPKCD